MKSQAEFGGQVSLRKTDIAMNAVFAQVAER